MLTITVLTMSALVFIWLKCWHSKEQKVSYFSVPSYTHIRTPVGNSQLLVHLQVINPFTHDSAKFKIDRFSKITA